MGSLYLRGNTWWIKFYRNGKCFRESTESTKKMVAKKVLARKEGDIAKGKIPGVRFDKVTFEDLADSFLKDYKINQKKSLVKAQRSVNHLKKSFERVNVPQITTPKINEFIESRINDGAANATINRELAALKRMLNLGAQQTPPIVDRVPHISMLEENNVRKGFFDHDEFLALRDALPEYLKGFVTFGYKSGWRVNEIKTLTWSNVDLQKRIAWLEIGMTKNKEGRTIYLDDELMEIFNTQRNLQKRGGLIVPYVFPNRKGDDGIKVFRRAWKTACTKAGIPNRIFHDLRRTAVRNMVRSGIPERVAMMISGHKTRSVFERYNIVSEGDLMIAAKKQEAYLKTQVGTNPGTVVEIPIKKAFSENR
ncbi:MAG: site-specific integrase [Proteobacteria bacterium]|nr:site-specific integrase [Pseudomonadota bacterium]MBU1542386.1 site-specific integrase [Pseudomonadota bacterium]